MLAKPWCIPYDEFCTEWQTVHDKGLEFGELRILGGETLLHPELDKLLTFLAELYPHTKIVVYTNGILLAREREKLLPVFQKYNITLFISRYPNIRIDYDKASEGFPSVTGYNANQFMRTCLHTTPTFVPDQMHRSCNNASVWQCRFLKDYHIYPCSTVPNFCFLTEYFPELKDTPFGQMDIEANGIDIRTHSIVEIESFLQRSIPACAFCNAFNARKFEPWYLSEYKLSEWFEDGPINNSSVS